MRSVWFCVPFLLAAFAVAQSTNFPVGPQYLITTSSPNLLRPLATPTLSLDLPLPPLPTLPEVGPAVEGVPYVSNSPVEGQGDLFPIFYGYPRLNVVEIISPGHSLNLPASVADTGTANVPSASVLDGLQTSLGEAVANWKASRRIATRLYSNADVERLPAASGLP
jgi:hypothetical protein